MQQGKKRRCPSEILRRLRSLVDVIEVEDILQQVFVYICPDQRPGLAISLLFSMCSSSRAALMHCYVSLTMPLKNESLFMGDDPVKYNSALELRLRHLFDIGQLQRGDHTCSTWTFGNSLVATDLPRLSEQMPGVGLARILFEAQRYFRRGFNWHTSIYVSTSHILTPTTARSFAWRY